MKDIIKVSIPNRLECLKWLYPVCEGILRELPFEDADRHMMMVSISEGFTNAFQHGNQKNPETEIRLSFCVTDKSLKIMIEDEAIMPIQDNINQAHGNVDPDSVSGRGLDLMRTIADQAFYEHDSSGINTLTLIFDYKAQSEKISNISGR